jgi:hypothetical protein
MRRAAPRLLAPLLCGLLLAACAPTVTNLPMKIEGRPAGEAGEPRMTITEDANGVRATAFVEGQYYAGRIVQESHEESYPVQEVETYKDRKGKTHQRIVQRWETRTVYEAEAFGLLTSGSSGDTLRCDFRLAEPAWGFSQGGIADCLASDGTRVVASF